MNRRELERIGLLLNCGGEGGKPGPCPQTVSASEVESYTAKGFKPTGKKTVIAGKLRSVEMLPPEGHVATEEVDKMTEDYNQRLKGMSKSQRRRTEEKFRLRSRGFDI